MKKKARVPLSRIPEPINCMPEPKKEKPKHYTRSRGNAAPYVSYSEKLKDPRWQRKRLEIMDRDSWQCRHCESKEKTLNVHHIYYHKGAAPWEYENEMLLTLCEKCHEMIEIRNKDMLKWVAESTEKQLAVMHYMAALDGEGPFYTEGGSPQKLAEKFRDFLLLWMDGYWAEDSDEDLKTAMVSACARVASCLFSCIKERDMAAMHRLVNLPISRK